MTLSQHTKMLGTVEIIYFYAVSVNKEAPFFCGAAAQCGL